MLSIADWAIVCGYLLISLAIGLYFARRASANLESFFLGGRNLPWWLAGLSLVATTFAADTPLLVTELVRMHGIAGNWFWWSLLFSGMLTTFFFARQWRRSGVLTDLEFITLRYSGRAAHALRGIRAVYLGVVVNALVIGWVNIALLTLLKLLFPTFGPAEHFLMLAASMGLTVIYSALSGLWGVVVTDAFQFVLATAACVLLAVYVVGSDKIGGLEGLAQQVPSQMLDFYPAIGEAAAGQGQGFALAFGVFFTMIALQWWASWYPGAEPGGGGYVVQRLLSARNERHALAATFMFQLFHYAVRPWPWILVGLATVVLYPTLPEAEYREGYVMAMLDFLPSGLLGLMTAGFFAAYMSTISTQLNWGVSYLVGDLYKPYLKPNLPERHYVLVSKLFTFLSMAVSLAITPLFGTITEAMDVLFNLGAGIGLVLMLRWFWWRVNAWSEIVAMLVPLVAYPVLQHGPWREDLTDGSLFFGARTPFVLVVAITTLSWLVTTRIKPLQTTAETLQAFVNRVQPRGWWGAFRPTKPAEHPTPLWALWACVGLGVLLVYGVLLGVGGIIFGKTADGILWVGSAIASALMLAYLARKHQILK